MRDGWLVCRISAVAHIQQGKALAATSMAGGAHPVFGANGVIGWHDAGSYGHEVVALGCRGSCGTVHIAPPDAWLANNVMAVWPIDPTVAMTRFLALALQAADLVTTGVVSGQVQPQITRTSLGPLEIPVPPLAEQRRIVDLIAAVETVVERARDASDRAASATQRLVRDYFERCEAEVRPLADVVTFASGYAFPIARQGGREGIPFFKVSDMNAPGNSRTMGAAANYVDGTTLRSMGARAWPEGTVVFPKVGAALLTEKRRVLGQRAAFDNNVMGLVPGPNVTSGYLYWFMRTVRLGDLAQHGALPSVNQGHLAGIKIPLPPVSDQERFCETAQGLQEATDAYAAVESAATTAKGALLYDLLSGDRDIPVAYDRFLDGAA